MKALFQYRLLIFFVLFSTFISIGLYVWRFRGVGLSGSTGDWANFATYISGTVGVSVVFATLVALVNTLQQQKVLINQQEEMLDVQKEQISLSDKHQRRVEAYSRVERILPKLVESCRRDMHAKVKERMGEKFYEYHSSYFPEQMLLRDIFDEKYAFYYSEITKEIYFARLWELYLLKIFNLAKLVSSCIEEADELQAFIHDQIYELETAIACVVIYAFTDEAYLEDAKRISCVLNLPTDYTGENIPQEMWQNIGRAQHLS